MDIFNDTFDKAKDLFFVAKQKTEDAVNVGKQKIDIATYENKLTKLYAALGKHAFDILKDKEDLSPKILDIIAQIKANKETLSKLKEELDRMQQKRICPACKSPVAEDAAFCGQCGEKIIFED